MTGQGTRTITVKFLNGFTTATAGDTLRVVVSSSCSTAVQKKLAIKAALPAAPTAITIGAIPVVQGTRADTINPPSQRLSNKLCPIISDVS
jgi:hypothetical protein